LSNAKQFSAGKFSVECDDGQYPVHVRITVDGREIAEVPHSELADLLHPLIRMQSHLRFHPDLKGRWHEV
jgi:hypothetical protein